MAGLLLSVLVASRVLVVVNIPVVNNGGYYGINVTKITSDLGREEVGFVRMNRAENSVVLPIKPAAVFQIGGPWLRPASEHISLRGENNVNLYYGTGFYVNWTRAESRRNRHNILFYFQHSSVKLDNVPLSRICTRDCYGRNPWDNQYVN